MGHVVVAPDKFKGSLTALEVAEAVGRGLLRVRGNLEIVLLPVADGGDGTVTAAVAAGYDRVRVGATGPTGEPVETSYARRGDLAVVELADVSGLGRLPGGVHRPLSATSAGTGEVIASALEAGCDHIVLGVGGSACTDGGAGMVRALGARILGRQGSAVADGGEALLGAAHLDLAPLRERISGIEVEVACDVDNPLTGPHGASRVYAPQKGADEQQVACLDRALEHWADLVAGATGSDHRHTAGAGAAGGVGFAAIALLGAHLRSGTDLVLDLVSFEQSLAGADLVVTGEGSLDEQSLRGKAPVGVAAVAQAHGVPVAAVCGRTTLGSEALSAAGIDAAYSLERLEPDPARSIAGAAPLLADVGADIAERHLAAVPPGGTA